MKRLREFTKKVRIAACRAVREYAREDSIPRSDYADTVKSLREGVCDGLDWFMLWDSIGTRPIQFFEENEGISELYDLAGEKWYGQVAKTRAR